MEAVDELEAERNQKRDEQQDVGQEGRHPRAGRVDVDIDAVGHKQEPGRKDAKEQDQRQRIEAFVEIGPGSRLDGRGFAYRSVECYIGHVRRPLTFWRGYF